MAKEKLVILGAGFGAFRLAMSISTNEYDVTLISPRDHFLFTPLLASTTVGTTEFRSIIEPVNLAQPGIRTLAAACVGIDPEKKELRCQAAGEPPTEFIETYDSLVIAVGVVSATYGIPGVDKYALPLKELGDARSIRQQIIGAIERSTLPYVELEEQKRLLTFVVVGGGPTGVEFAGELHDFIEEDVRRLVPKIADQAKIILVDAGETLLSAFDKRLGEYTNRIFSRRKIDVRTSSLVKEVRENSLVLNDGEEIKFGVLVWSAGVSANPLLNELKLERDRLGRIITDEYLKVPEYPGVYAIGDCATVLDKDYPMTAQLAQQEGKYLAKALNRLKAGKEIKPFRYIHLGMLAYIGGKKGLADTPGIKWRGFAAWLIWRSVYITKLVSLRNKIRVFFDWIRTSIFGRDIASF